MLSQLWANAFIFPRVCILLDAHVPLFIYPACILDDCFQFIIQDLGFMLELCSRRSVIMQRCRRKLRLLQFLFVFSFQVFTHCGPVRQWPLTWAFFHWKFLICILKIASNVRNHVQYFLKKLQSGCGHFFHCQGENAKKPAGLPSVPLQVRANGVRLVSSGIGVREGRHRSFL